MSTNDDEATEAPAEEVSTTQEDEQLRQDLKNSIANDTKTEASDTEPAPNAETAEAEGKPEATLTTEVLPEPDKDLAWYKTAYAESTKESLRLKGELDKKVEPLPVAPVATDEVLTPEQLYIRTQLIKESDQAFAQIVQKYPDANSPENRDRFKQTSEEVSKVIVASEKRFPEALELYEKTAVILGLQPDNSEALSAAVRDSGTATRTPSGTAAIPPQSKVTEAMIAMNLKMFPGKSRQEIIEELEPHIN